MSEEISTEKLATKLAGEDRAVRMHMCAELAHEANRILCLSKGDTSQSHWEEAPEWQRESAMRGVEGVILKGNTPRASHDSWLDDKRRAGWKWGPEKNVEKKEHPCFVPYDELSPADRMKDLVFVSVVKAFAEALGL